MKNKTDNGKALALLFPLLVLLKWIPGLPWWGFLVPVTVLSTLISYRQWQVAYFKIGLVAGSVLWLAGNLLWDRLLPGHILSAFGPLVNILLLVAAGLLGGLLTGLAMLTGRYLGQALTEAATKA